MATKTYSVTGMTCGHCVSSVDTGIRRLDWVRDVTVDLAKGEVAVIADGAVDDAAVAAAVAAAGYEVTS